VQTTDTNKYKRQMSTGMYEKKKDKINRTYQASWIEITKYISWSGNKTIERREN
jgi:hypothetical protein